MYVDSSITNQFALLDIYNISSDSYLIRQYNYGNLAANQRPVAPTTPVLINFEEPNFD
jgi:hypothetical protein